MQHPTLTAVFYNSTRCDMFNTSANLLSNQHIFTFLNKSKMLLGLQLYFCSLIATENEERLAVTSSHTILMHHKSYKVKSFFQEFPTFFFIKTVLKMQ